MKLLKNIGVVTVSNVLNAAIPFLLLPILTKYLSTAEYGILDIFQTTMSFLLPLVGLNFYAGITVFYYDKTVDNSAYIGTGLSLTFLSAILLLIICGIIYIISPAIFHQYYLVYIVLAALFKIINENLSSFWLMGQKTLYYGLFKVIRTLTELLLALLFVALFLWGVHGRIGSIVIIPGVAAVFSLILFVKKHNVKFAIDKKLLHKGLLYSVPLIFHSIGGSILNISDRYFIAGMVSDSELGIYSVAYQIGMSFYIIQISFNQAWVPYFMKTINNEKFDKVKMVKHTYLYALISILIFMLLYLFIPVFYWFIDPNYHSGKDIVPWVLGGFLFNGFYFMVVNYLFALKKTKIIAITTITVGMINIVLNYFFINFWGIKGAAISTTISFFISFVFFWIMSNKYFPMPWFSAIKSKIAI